jgi:hypothetical protein
MFKELVIIETPFKGDECRNVKYLSAALIDSLHRGEAPFASHAIYTLPGVLDDNDPAERELGMVAGFAWQRVANKTVVYKDLGISSGMVKGINLALSNGLELEFRSLPEYFNDL